MGFLTPEFTHDIFVSYSHGDFDQDGASMLKDWSAKFVRELENELRQDPDFSQLSIFRDENERPDQGLDPTLPLTEQLKGQIEGSALLLALMTPHYVGSKWCGDERDWWFEAMADDGLGAGGRAFLARIWPTKEDSWPKQFRDQRGHEHLGFWFHDRENVSRGTRPFAWPDCTKAGNPFRAELLRLVGLIYKRLEELKERLEARRTAEAARQRLLLPDSQVLYLHARESQSQAWETACEELEALNYVVEPDQPEPETTNQAKLRELDERRVNQLIGCDGLLILGTEHQELLSGDILLLGRHARQQALSRADKPLPCAVLDVLGHETRPARRINNARRYGVEWIDHTLTGWEGQVRTWLVEASDSGDVVEAEPVA